MDGFGPALDGYYDVDDQLTRYLRARADAHFAATREARRSETTVRAFEARRARVREAFLDGIGGLPDRMDDSAVEVTGRLDRDGHAVELLAFESRPAFHVTANCYVPHGEGPHPAVLFLCGHVDDPKRDAANQRACLELVANGFVVLVVDPVGQGEREQYRDPETGAALVAGGGGVFEHCYAGQKLVYAGGNLARYVVHDARCALDYLAGRADVDADRLGVTGASGGGIQTLYLSLVDDRVAAAAPCCSVTDRREWLKTGKRIDAEQTLFGAIAEGIGYDDLLAGIAPRPVCVGAAASDEYFPVEGVRETVDRVRRVYDRYDAASNVDLVIAETTHCSVSELGDGVFEWFCDRLGDGPYEPHPDPRPVAGDALRCTPEGSVRAAYDDERTIDDLIREFVAETAPDAGTRPDPADASPARVRRAVVETLSLDRDGCALAPRFVHHEDEEADGLSVDRVWFRTERDPDAVVAGVLVADPTVDADAPAVCLFEDGTAELPDRRDDVAALAREYGAVFVFDPRGVGAVRNRAIPIPRWVDDYDGIYGTEFKLAADALQLGSSLFGMRVFDVGRAAAFLRAETGADRVSFVGEGTGAYHALYAAAVADDVARVSLRGLGPAFVELATGREVPFRPRLTVYDVVGECDVPRVRAALAHRGVDVAEADVP